MVQRRNKQWSHSLSSILAQAQPQQDALITPILIPVSPVWIQQQRQTNTQADASVLSITLNHSDGLKCCILFFPSFYSSWTSTNSTSWFCSVTKWKFELDRASLFCPFYTCFSCFYLPNHHHTPFFLWWVQIMGISLAQPQPSRPIISWLQAALSALGDSTIVQCFEMATCHYILSAALFLMVLDCRSMCDCMYVSSWLYSSNRKSSYQIPFFLFLFCSTENILLYEGIKPLRERGRQTVRKTWGEVEGSEIKSKEQS